MRKPLDTIPWRYGTVTGGGDIILTTGGLLVVVSSVRNDGTLAVLESADLGQTWVVRSTYALYPPTPLSTTVKLGDPQVTYSHTDDVVHIIIPKETGVTSNDLLLFSYPVATKTLSAPTTLITAQAFKASYGVCFDDAASEVVVVAMAVNPTSPNTLTGKLGLIEVVLDLAHNVVRTNLIFSTSSFDQNTYNGVQVLNTTTGLEMYAVRRPRIYPFKPQTSSLVSYSRASGNSPWGAEQVLFTFTAEFTDNKLTVLSHGTDRYLAFVWYAKQVTPGLTDKLLYNVELGYNTTGTWNFTRMPNDSKASEPTLSLSPTGVLTLAYLTKNPDSLSRGVLNLHTWDPVTGVMTPVAFQPTQLTHLRAFQPLPTGNTGSPADWEYVGVDAAGDLSWYVSSINLPPVPSITAPTSVKRQVPALIDASATMDPDADPLVFTWTVDPSTTFPSQVTLTPNALGTTCSVYVHNAWGPDPGNVVVHMSVTDNVNAPVVRTVTMAVPQNYPPTVNWYSDPVYSDSRYGTVVLAPIITDPNGGEILSYLWTQTSGSPATVVGGWTSPSLTVQLTQSRVLGETTTFTLRVSNDVNPPVYSHVSLVVPPVKNTPATLDLNFINRAIWYSGV